MAGVLKYSLRLIETDKDNKCNFCRAWKPKGSIMIEYRLEDSVTKLTCLHHKVCETFQAFGFFCSNHEANQDVDCSEVLI